jgi:hypothetical protein
MPAIRMTHPDHGYHNAHDNAEADTMKKAGWKPISEDEFRKIIDAKLGKSSESVEESAVGAEEARPEAEGR